MKFLLDMNLSPNWATALTDAGWEATHWSQVGKADASDLEILRFAAANDFVVVTHDLDFGAILAVTHGRKPSVVQIRSMDLSPNTIASYLTAALRHAERELASGALLTIEASRTRLRILPLRVEE